MRLSSAPTEVRFPPPKLGEHTEEVLSELLGIDVADMEQLRKDGII